MCPVVASLTVIYLWGTSKLGYKTDECVGEQATLIEVGNQRAVRLVKRTHHRPRTDTKPPRACTTIGDVGMACGVNGIVVVPVHIATAIVGDSLSIDMRMEWFAAVDGHVTHSGLN